MHRLVTPFVLGLLACVAVGLTASHSRAETITVGVENIDYYPHYTTKDGMYADSFARKLLDAFAKQKGYTLVYKPMPVKRLFKAFVNGDVDLKYPDTAYWFPDAKKGLDVMYSDPVVDYIDGVMVKPENKNIGMAGLKHMGVILGFTAWDFRTAVQEGTVKRDPSNNFMALLKRTIAGRNDGAYGNIVAAKYHLRESLKQPDALVFGDKLPHTRSSYRLSSINRPDVVRAFNEFLAENADLVVSLKEEYRVESGLN